MGIGKSRILLAGLQQERKSSQLLGTGIEVDACEVVLENVLDSLGACVAFIYIKVIEQVEALVEDVAGAARKIRHLQVCQFFIFQDSVLAWLLCRLHEILPLLLKPGLVGVVVKIDSAHGVLHHVLHDPVRGENLSGGRDLVSLELALLGEHLVLALGDIELVQPADQLW